MATTLKDRITEEFKKCAKDPGYFMSKYCIIQHPVKGKIYFNLFKFQTETLWQFIRNTYTIVLKSRQLGISTLVAGYSLWLMLFHNDKSILVIATKQGVAKNLVTKVRIMHDNLPSWLKGDVLEDNKLGLRFANGSNIKAEASSPDAGRSEALSLLVLDEAAFIKDIDSIWSAASLTLATGGDCIWLSTPNGVGNLFHKIWKSAEEGVPFEGIASEEDIDDGSKEPNIPMDAAFLFNPIKLHWTVHPERDEAWRQRQNGLLGKRKAAQECDCDFITSGNTVVEGEIIKWYEDNKVAAPLIKEGIDHNLWIWKYPDYSKTYLVSADVARGDGSDFSAAQVLDVDSVEIVAEYKGRLGTTEFGNFLVSLATQYNDALLVVENASWGWGTVQQVVARNYKNMLYSSADMTKVDIQSQIRRGYDTRTPTNTAKLVAGFSMTPKIRPLVESKIDEYFRHKDIDAYSKRLINELYTWVWMAGRADHLDGYNDDAIIALGIGLLIRDTALKLRQRGIEMQRKAISNIHVTRPIYTPATRPMYDPYHMRVGGGHIEDLRWLIDSPTPEQVEARKKAEEEKRKADIEENGNNENS